MWMTELNEKWSSGVSVGFILHLNTADYVPPNVPLKSYLSQSLAEKNIIAFYNRSGGITFPVESMIAPFKKVVGFQPDPLAGDELPKTPAQALPLLEKLLKVNQNSAVIIEDAETLIPDADTAMMIPEDRTNLVTIRRWASDQEIAKNNNMIILITGNLSEINQSVRAASSRYESIRLPYPDAANRAAFIEHLNKRKDDDNGKDYYDFDRQVDDSTLVRATAGLPLIRIEDIYLRAKQTGVLSWDLISERKRDVMKSEFADVLEIMEPRFGFEDIGGLEQVKDFFKKNIITPMKNGNYGRVPMGVLMTGPAGTGKTIMAEAVAKMSGINMAILNPAKIFSKWVGESERNLEKALEAVKSLAPAIVFIDEIDQSLRRGESGDSGVSNRIFKRLMEFTSDTGNRGQVVFLAATNRPDLLDAALKRPGRFDVKIPFLAPDEKSLASIFGVMIRKYKVTTREIDPLTLTEWAKATKGWTGAEIERLVIKAGALKEDQDLPLDEAMKLALTYIRAKTQDIKFMTQVAIDNCDDLEFVPKEFWKEYIKEEEKVND